MNARSGVVLALGLLLLGLILVLRGNLRFREEELLSAPIGGPATTSESAGAVVVPVVGSTEVGAAVRRLASDEGGFRLRVLDAADRSPLPGAIVRWLRAGQSWSVAAPAHDGAVQLPTGGDEHLDLHVTCAGYCTLEGRLILGGDAAEVLLQRGGSVELRVLDESGRPAAGIEVVLLPPLVAGAWEADWPTLRTRTEPFVPADTVVSLRIADGVVTAGADPIELGAFRAIEPQHLACMPLRRTTDADGVAHWSGVAPGKSYRCGILGRHHADLVPVHEASRLRASPRGVVVGRPPPVSLSGSFCVQTTKQSQVGASLVGHAAVQGTVRCRPAADVLVKLCRIHQAGGGDVRPVTTVDAESCQQLDVDGRFRFENVRPGIFAIRACWLENDHDVYFVSTTLRLLSNMDLDLGELLPMSGMDVRVRAELHAHGDRTAPERVFVDPRQAVARLSLSFLPDSQSVADAVTEVAVVPFGKDYVLHGVPAGRLQLQAAPVDGLAILPWVQRLDAGEVLDRPLAELGDAVPVAVRIHAGVAMRLTVVDESGDGVPLAAVHSVNLDSGFVQSLTVDQEVQPGSSERLVRIPRGRHQLCASLFVGGRWIAGVTQCDVGDQPASLRLDMLPAASIRGRFVATVGRDRLSPTLRWSPAAFAKRGVWLFSAAPNAQGEFELVGLPAGIEIEGDEGLPTLRPVAADDVLDIGAITDR
jgi:hypothetical protein